MKVPYFPKTNHHTTIAELNTKGVSFVAISQVCVPVMLILLMAGLQSMLFLQTFITIVQLVSTSNRQLNKGY
jgi:hypothetical protein